ncbi:bifunctional oligoribonuclease/PAP phosphatase NrnA [Candidatus Omnitrophota bacterium]
MSVKRIVQALKKHNTFIISAHIDLEGDALGSEIALGYLLKAMKKKVYIINNDPTPAEYAFLPGKAMFAKRKELPSAAVFIAVDCSDLKRLGRVAQIADTAKLVINIDHHMSNERFADINWVDAKASSASEMVFKLFKALRRPLSKDAALALYTGIATDTGWFKYSNTTAATHAMVVELVKQGIDSYKIYRHIYQNFSIRAIQHIGTILNAIEVDSSGGIAWVTLREGSGMRSVPGGISDIVFGFLRSIAGIEVAIIFRQKKKKLTKVNLRSQSRVNVGAFAQKFGGGGHSRASGFVYPASLAVTKSHIVAQLKKKVYAKA